MQSSFGQARAELAERLGERREEIEQAVLARAYTTADPTETPDPLYTEGLRDSVAAAIAYGIEALERGEERVLSVLLTQARVAARNGVGLDTVLRRYFAGYTLLGDFLVKEVRADALLDADELGRVLCDQAALFDRLLSAVSEEEFQRETKQHIATTEQRRIQCVERLLAGELTDATELDYDLETWHLGLVACGADAEVELRKLAASMDACLLLVRREEGAVWAWLGSAVDSTRAPTASGGSPPARKRLTGGGRAGKRTSTESMPALVNQLDWRSPASLVSAYG